MHPRPYFRERSYILVCICVSWLYNHVQEKDSLNSIIDLIERCHPNVVLVEKTVSRDIQESILSKGMTLVFDMKLHRLERVARCTSSPILSTDMLIGQKLKQCDSFHIEKFVEEHAAFGEGGKRPSKTLMFLEGCPTRRGCTVSFFSPCLFLVWYTAFYIIMVYIMVEFH